MEAIPTHGAAAQDSARSAERPEAAMGIIPILGTLLLMWSAAAYSVYGLAAYPHQEWLIETLAAIIFVLPVVKLLQGRGHPERLGSTIRLIGAMLLLHSVWDALHWPGHAVIHSPVDPFVPRICPFLDLPMGFLLLVRGK
jgi:hypothetical protein